MNLITLTHTQYSNYSNIHNQRNFGQTVEYSLLEENQKDSKLFLGLIDNSNNLCAAALILVTNISPNIKEAYAPNGFLIDYSNFDLVKTFTEELIKYLKKEKVTYLITNPMFKYRIYNKKNMIIENNINILDNLIRLDYQPVGYSNDFSKYDIVIEDYDNKENIFRKFNRNTKRNIKESLNMGITLHKGSIKDIEEFYNIIKKKSRHNLSYYYNLMNTYNTKDNKMEIFFTKLDPQRFLINIKKIYESEVRRNEVIHKSIQNKQGKMTEKILNKKINSDSLLEKYRELLNKAIDFSKNHEDSVIIGTSAIIRNNKEIYFLIDGYKEEYRAIHSSHILKWALVKKYSSLGYKIFNLGEIHKDYQNKNSKYHGQYMYKIGFGGNIIEYPPNLLLVINKPMYSAYIKLNKLIQKKKSN
ncbi:MAG: peptidoglycan bridge formation glycyltransferase FemA/FemB family protein [Bacilli bacterium]|nr:peptidoglycan bridge formation glycyltransferase FemA/FemB family protein [Bacilli bacterium]